MNFVNRVISALTAIKQANSGDKIEQEHISLIMVFVTISIFSILVLLLLNEPLLSFISYCYIMSLIFLCACKLLSFNKQGVILGIAIFFFLIHLSLWLIFNSLFESENFLQIDDLFEAIMYVLFFVALNFVEYKSKPVSSIYFLITILLISLIFINPIFLNSTKLPLDTIIDVILINIVLFKASPHIESFIKGLAPDGRFFWISGLIMAWMAEPVDGMLEVGIKVFDTKFTEFLFVVSIFYIAIGFLAEFQKWKIELWPFAIGVGSLLIAWIAGIVISYSATPILHHTWALVGGYIIFILSTAIIMSNRIRLNRTNRQLAGWSKLVDEITEKHTKDGSVEKLVDKVFSILKKNINNIIGISLNLPYKIQRGNNSDFSIQIFDRNEPIGHLFLKEQTINIEDLEAFTPILGRRLREEITKTEWRNKALTDQLTGLLNRSGYNLMIFDILNKCQTSNLNLTVSMIDIDYFKKVNDTFGHNTGDNVLVTLANLLKQSLRKEDLIIRWGGEEFLALLIDTGVAQAEKVINRIRENLTKIKIEPVNWTVTFSSGIAGEIIPKNISEVEKLIQKADSALYKSKENGRNRVTIVTE